MANKSFAAMLKERKKTINPPAEEEDKVEVAEKVEEPKTVTPDPVPAYKRKKKKKAEAKPKPSPVRPTLYVNCIPRHTEVQYLDEVVQDIMREVAEDAAVPHYSLMPYNEGPKRVVAMLSNKVELGDVVLPEKLVVHTSFPFASACLEYLMSKYTEIVERSY